MDKKTKAINKLLENGGARICYGDPSDGYCATLAVLQNLEGVQYVIGYHKYDMPEFYSESFSTVEELAEAGLRLQPDLRRWRK